MRTFRSMWVERARREAEIQLDNDNLIRMYGFVETVSTVGNRARAYYHVVMELLIGVTLEILSMASQWTRVACRFHLPQKSITNMCKTGILPLYG